MSNKKEDTQENISKSKAKREQRKKEVQQHKRRSKLEKIVGITVAACVAVVIIACIGVNVYYKVTATVSSSDYSALLSDDGFIQDVDTNAYVSSFDYNSITVPLAVIEYTDESVDADIQSVLTNNREAVSDSSLAIADGDTVNIDYVGTIDGVAFEGGDTQGQGTDLTIGSGSYVDDFETQLIGAHPGDSLTVDVTFPVDYQTAELAGQDASFAVTVNSIYVLPEFTDEFVASTLSDYATTADGYREYLKTTHYAENLKEYLTTYIKDNASISSYPKDYLKQQKSIAKYNDEQTFAAINEMYYSYTGSYRYADFSEYNESSDREYEKTLLETARIQTATDLTYQYLFKELGLSISDADYTAKLTEMGTDAETTYGKGYVMQQLMHDKVIAALSEIVTVQ